MGIFDQKYIDQDYDGLIIKVPNYIFDLNPDLYKSLLTFLSEMEKAKFGTQHPDFQKSMFEIKNLDNKKVFAEQSKQEKNQRLEQSRILEEKRLNHDIIDITVDKYRVQGGEYSIIWFSDEDQIKDFYTQKSGIKKPIKDKFQKCLSQWSLKQFLEFLSHNDLFMDDTILSPTNSYKSADIYMGGSYGNLSFSCNREKIQLYEKTRNNKLVYYEQSLYYSQAKEQYYIRGVINGVEKTKYSGMTVTFLSDYEREGNKFIRKGKAPN